MAELAWPEDLGHGTFVGRFGFMDADSHDPDREPDITSATGGTVTITPSVKSVRYKGTGGPMILAARSARGIIDSEGYLCTAAQGGSAGDRGMVFPATDDTDLNPTDWTYEVSIVLDGQVRIPAFHVKLPTDATVDLSLAVPVPSSGGTAVVVDTTTAERAENAATRAEAAADAAEEWTPAFEWDDLTGKPDTFPPSAHTHPISDVTGLQAALDGAGGGGGASSWSELTDKPTTFPPSAHSHTWAQVTGKPTTFAPSAHTHTVANVTGLQADLDGKADAEHLHQMSEVEGLEDALGSIGEDAPPVPVSSADITDATDVGRAILTAPLSVNARNALSIFTGTRALLDEGTDTAERTWDAKELHEYVTETAAGGGAASWGDLTGKPATFPSTIPEVEGLQAALDAAGAEDWDAAIAAYEEEVA